jgi:uncharacterized membrane protein YdbT with pleckstrin-like domain
MSKQKIHKGFPGQHDHEEVLLVFRHHLMSIRKELIVSMLVIVVGMLPVTIWPTNTLALQFLGIVSVLALAYFIWAWVGWYYSVYIATNERIIEVHQRGFFDRRVTEFGLDKIQNINYHIKGLQAVIFRYGTIAVRTYVGDLVMKGIHNPVGIQQKLVKIVQQYGRIEDKN